MIACICESCLNYEFHELCTIDDDYKSDLRERLPSFNTCISCHGSKRVDQI